MNLAQKLALIQRNQAMIDLLSANNTEIMNGIIMENTLSNLADVPGLPVDLERVIRQALGGQRISLPSFRTMPQAMPQETTVASRARRRSKLPTPSARNPGFYDTLILNYARSHNGQVSVREFRDATVGKYGIPDTFFRTTMYSKFLSMTRPTKGKPAPLRKIANGIYQLIETAKTADAH